MVVAATQQGESNCSLFQDLRRRVDSGDWLATIKDDHGLTRRREALERKIEQFTAAKDLLEKKLVL